MRVLAVVHAAQRGQAAVGAVVERPASEHGLAAPTTDRRGACGVGCAAPDLEVTGERAVTVLDTLQTAVREALIGSDPLRPAMLLERLRKPLAGQPSAMAAVDMAETPASIFSLRVPRIWHGASGSVISSMATRD